MANYHRPLSTLFPVGCPGNVKPALTLYRRFAKEKERRGEAVGFEAEAHVLPGGASLWLHAGESADVENVIAFALRCAERFDLKGLWGFQWACTCSRARLDGFGGGAQVLDLGKRESVAWLDCEHWIADQVARLSAPAEPAQDIFVPVSAGQGWRPETDAALLLDFVDREIKADPDVAGRLRAYLAEVSAVPEGMLCRECGEAMFIEPNGVSHHAGNEGKEGINYERDFNHVAVAEREP